ncbi:MAG: helix-turn-helix domain-containing protein [Terracidiphilus sp.]|jgi:HTH-type transcriptional regulator/antitoxin HigA
MPQHRVPAEVFPPGEFIRDELEERGWTQTDLAEILGRPLRLVNELIAGKKQITPDTAQGLAEAFGTDAILWMNLDSQYRLARIQRTDDSVRRRSSLYAKFPVRELVKRRWIEQSGQIDVLEERVKQFYEIECLDEEPSFAHAAMATQYVKRTNLQWGWLYRAKRLAEVLTPPPYSSKKLQAALTKLKEMLISPEAIRLVARVLNDAGVRFVIVEFLPGSKIDGATFWINDSPVIAMSIRYDRIDNFWFVLRHECEHVLRGDGRENGVLDVDLMENLGGDGPEEEIAANDAAQKFLVPPAEIENFIARVRPLYSEERVLLFSKRIGVHPGIVVGQLQRKKEVPYSHFRKHQVKVRQIVTQTALADGWGDTPDLEGQ